MSQISSDPIGVIFCNEEDDTPEYETREMRKCVYPGEDFHISATTVVGSCFPHLGFHVAENKLGEVLSMKQE